MREVILYNFQKHIIFTLKKRLAAGTMVKYGITFFIGCSQFISYLVIFFLIYNVRNDWHIITNWFSLIHYDRNRHFDSSRDVENFPIGLGTIRFHNNSFRDKRNNSDRKSCVPIHLLIRFDLACFCGLLLESQNCSIKFHFQLTIHNYVLSYFHTISIGHFESIDFSYRLTV